MNIICLPCMGTFGVNCYIIENSSSDCVLIDAPAGAEYILSEIEKRGLKLKKILLTHGHCDHIETAAEISEKTGAEVYIHEADMKKLSNPNTNLTAYFGLPPVAAAENAVAVSGGDIISEGELEFKVLHTPGHTSGSVCYIMGDNMFCGDTLFRRSMGRTDMPDGDDDVMLGTLAMLYDFDKDVDYKLFSGHGEMTSMTEERANNPYMKYAHKAVSQGM